MQVRAEFVQAGYGVDKPVDWTLASTGTTVTTFDVWDRTEDAGPEARLIMVLVFPSVESAELHRSLSAARVPDLHNDGLSAELGPPLVAGYGLSRWRSNVAIVETTRSLRQRWYTPASDLTTDFAVEIPLPLVAEDFMRTLDPAASNT